MDKWLIDRQLPVHLISACGIVYKDGLILLIRNPKRGWEMPGGTIEQGEEIVEGLKREIFEESGILCEPEQMTGVYQNLLIKDGYGPLEGMKIPPVTNFAFICRYIGGEAAVSDESDDVRWAAPDEAKALVTHPLYEKRLADALCFDGRTTLCTYEFDNKLMILKSDMKL